MDFFFQKSEEYPYQNIAKATATHFGTAVCSNGHVAPRLSRSKIESLQQKKKTEKSERQRLTAKDLAQGEKLFPLPSNVCLASTRDNNATILQNFPRTRTRAMPPFDHTYNATLSYFLCPPSLHWSGTESSGPSTNYRDPIGLEALLWLRDNSDEKFQLKIENLLSCCCRLLHE